MEVVTTSYAKTKMKQRGISEKMVIETLSNPEVTQPAYKNRYAHDLYPFSSKKGLNLCKVFSRFQKWKVCSSYIRNKK